MTDEANQPALTDTSAEVLEVTQADREAAASIFDLYAPNYAELARNNSPHIDRLAVTQTLARHRLSALRATSPDTPVDGVRWSWGYADGVRGTPEYEQPRRVCNWCKTVESRCRCDASTPTTAPAVALLRQLSDALAISIAEPDPEIVLGQLEQNKAALDAFLSDPKS